MEAKLKAAVQDKNGEQMEKVALEREVKMLRAQNDRITKNIDKVCAAHDASSYLCSKILWKVKRTVNPFESEPTVLLSLPFHASRSAG